MSVLTGCPYKGGLNLEKMYSFFLTGINQTVHNNGVSVLSGSSVKLDCISEAHENVALQNCKISQPFVWWMAQTFLTIQTSIRICNFVEPLKLVKFSTH